MSTINVRGLALQAVQNTFSPPEGPKALPLALDFATDPQPFLYVADLYNHGPGYPGLSGLQTLYVDNTNGAGDMTVNVEGSGQKLKIKAGMQGFYPVISPKQGRIIFTGSGGLVTVLLLNFTVAAYEWEGV